MLRVVLAGNKQRGMSCLNSVSKNHEIVGVVGHPKSGHQNSFIDRAKYNDFKIFQPDNINSSEFLKEIRSIGPDVIILAGYGKIVQNDFISIAKYGCINLHGGKLPKYRGSSPMNWALINGETNFTLSIIQVDLGIDTGDILAEETHPIKPEYDISSLHKIANDVFPQLLDKVLADLEEGNLKPISQKKAESSYYPIRFPEDGLIFFDRLNAEEIHNRVRALAPPYPGVTTFFMDKKIKIIRTKLTERPYFGEAGRIYKISEKNGVLVCAKDKCLWLEEVVDFNSKKNCIDIFTRYRKMATVNQVAQDFYDNK